MNLKSRKVKLAILFLIGAATFFAVKGIAEGTGLFDLIGDALSGNKYPLHKAAQRGNLKEIKRLLEAGTDVNTKDENGQTALHTAAIYGKTESAKLLIEKGASLETRDNKKFSPLYYAAYQNKTETIKQLIESGAKVDGKNSDYNYTALYGAIINNKKDAAEVLIKNGADVNFQIWEFPSSPLQFAAGLGRTEIVKILLNNGANVNFRDPNSGMTALYMATVNGDEKMVRLLKEYGADETIEDNYGQNPKQAAELIAARKTRKILAAGSNPTINSDAIVQLVYFSTQQNRWTYHGPNRNSFAICDGTLVVTAAHCIGDFQEDINKPVISKPKLISRFYGDIFEAEIIAIDNDADVAILKVNWPGHPAFEPASYEELIKSKEAIVAGWPPGKKVKSRYEFSKGISFQQLPIIHLDQNDKKSGIVLGGQNFAAPGWSGSPIILADSGKIAGVFARTPRTEFNKKLFMDNAMGCSVNSIYEIINKAQINLENLTAKIPDRKADCEKAYSTIIGCIEILSRNDIPSALSEAQKLVSLRPQSVEAHLLLAGLAMGNEGADKTGDLAESNIKAALNLEPNNITAIAAYANFLHQQNRIKEATDKLNKIIEIEPDNSFSLYKLAAILKGKDPNQAEVYAKRLTEKHPDNPDYWYELANIFSNLKKYDEELQAAQKAVSLNKTVPYQHRRRLADTLKHIKKYGESEEQYKLLFKDHQCAVCWYAYAILLAEIGKDRYDDALKAVDKAQSMNQKKLVNPKQLENLKEKVLLAKGIKNASLEIEEVNITEK